MGYGGCCDLICVGIQNQCQPPGPSRLRDWVIPVSMKVMPYLYVAKSKHKLNPPIWDTRVLKAMHLVLIIHSHILLLVTALLEHYVSLLFVERAAHPTVCWMH